MPPREESIKQIVSISAKVSNGGSRTDETIEREANGPDMDPDNSSNTSKKKKPRFTCKQKMVLILLCAADFMAYCAVSLLAPFFPREAQSKGIAETMLGLMFSFPSLVMFLTSPVMGKLIPKFGERLIFNAGFVLVGISHIAFGTLVYVNNYTLFVFLCFFIRGVQALGASGYITASFVYASKMFPDRTGLVRGTLETFVGLGLSVGPAIGGFLYSVGGFGLPFYVMGAIAILMIPLNLFILPDTISNKDDDQKSESMWKLIRVPAVFLNCLTVVVVSLTWGFIEPYLEPHLRQFFLTPTQVGFVFLLLAGMYALSAPGWGWVADRVKNLSTLMTMGLFTNCIALLLIGPSPFFSFITQSLWLVIVCLIIVGLSTAMTLMPTFNAFLAAAFTSGLEDSLATHSLVAGLWSSMYALGEVIGPSLGGLLIEQYNYQIASTVIAAMNFIVIIICLVFNNWSRFKSKPKPAQIENGMQGVWRIRPL